MKIIHFLITALIVVAPIITSVNKITAQDNPFNLHLNCVGLNANGTYTAYFGYTNSTEALVKIDKHNVLPQGSNYEYLPEVLELGRQHAVVKITASQTEEISWNAISGHYGSTAKASINSEKCSYNTHPGDEIEIESLSIDGNNHYTNKVEPDVEIKFKKGSSNALSSTRVITCNLVDECESAIEYYNKLAQLQSTNAEEAEELLKAKPAYEWEDWQEPQDFFVKTNTFKANLVEPTKSGEKTVCLEARDLNNNLLPIVCKEIYLDNKAPIGTIEIFPHYDEYKIDIIAEDPDLDDGSPGIWHTRYRLNYNRGEWSEWRDTYDNYPVSLPYTPQLDLSTNLVELQLIDGLGNESEVIEVLEEGEGVSRVGEQSDSDPNAMRNLNLLTQNTQIVEVMPPCDLRISTEQMNAQRFHWGDPWGGAGHAVDLNSAHCKSDDLVASISGAVTRRIESGICEAPGMPAFAFTQEVLEISHLDGTKVSYRHQNVDYSSQVLSGRVESGDPISSMGSVGCSTGKHLHFEVWKYGVKLNYNQWKFSEGKRITITAPTTNSVVNPIGSTAFKWKEYSDTGGGKTHHYQYYIEGSRSQDGPWTYITSKDGVKGSGEINAGTFNLIPYSKQFNYVRFKVQAYYEDKQKGTNASTPWSEKVLKFVDAPELLSPAPDKEFEINEQVTLSWSNVNAAQYNVELVWDNGSRNITTSSRSITLSDLPPNKDIKWKVSVTRLGHKISSEERKFKINYKTPKIIEPIGNIPYPDGDIPVVLEKAPHKYPQVQYRYQISKNSNFSAPIVSTGWIYHSNNLSSIHKMSSYIPSTGQFFIRVQQRDLHHQSEWSTAVPFKISHTNLEAYTFTPNNGAYEGEPMMVQTLVNNNREIYMRLSQDGNFDENEDIEKWVLQPGLSRNNITMAEFNLGEEKRLYQMAKGRGTDTLYSRYTTNLTEWTDWYATQSNKDIKWGSDTTTIEFEGRLHQFGFDREDKAIYTRSTQDGTFDLSEAAEEWSKMEGQTSRTVSAHIWNNRLYLAVRGSNLISGAMYHRYTQDGVSWNNWQTLRDGQTSGSVVMHEMDGKLCQTVRGNSAAGNIFIRCTANGNYTDATWEKQPGQAGSEITNTYFRNGFYQFTRGIGESAKTYTRITKDTKFDGMDLITFTQAETTALELEEWKRLHGAAGGTIRGAEYTVQEGSLTGHRYFQAMNDADGSGKILMQNTSDGIFDASQPSENWANVSNLVSGATPSDITMIEFDSKLFQAVRGLNNNVYLRYTTDGIFDGKTHTGDPAPNELWQIQAGQVSESIEMAVFNGRLYQSARGLSGGRIYMRSSATGNFATEAQCSTGNAADSNECWQNLSALIPATAGSSLPLATITVEGQERLYQIMKGAGNGYAYWRYTTDGNFDGSNSSENWKSISANFVGNLAVASFDNEVYIAGRNSNGMAFYTKSTNGNFVQNQTWIDTKGTSITHISFGKFDDKLYMNAVNINRQIWQKITFDGVFDNMKNGTPTPKAAWENWHEHLANETWKEQIGNTSGNINMAVFNGQLYQAMRRNNNSGEIFMRKSLTGDFTGIPWARQEGQTAGNIIMQSFTPTTGPNTGTEYLYQAVRGNNATNIYLRRSADGVFNSPEEQWQLQPGQAAGDIQMTVHNGRLYQSVRGLSNTFYIRSTSDGAFDGSEEEETWQLLNRIGRSDLTMASYAGRLVLTYTNGGRIWTAFVTDWQEAMQWIDVTQKTGRTADRSVNMEVFNPGPGARLYLTAKDFNSDTMYYMYTTDTNFNSNGSAEDTWYKLPGLTSKDILMQSYNHALYLTTRGSGNEGRIFMMHSTDGLFDASGYL